jgi:hypothetical protein
MGCLLCILHMYIGCLVCNMHVYAGSSAEGRIHAPKNGFLREILNSNLEKCVSEKANSMYA